MILVKLGRRSEEIVDNLLLAGLQFHLHLGDVDDGAETFLTDLITGYKLLLVCLIINTCYEYEMS